MNTTAIIDIQELSFPWQTQDPFLFCVHHRDEYPEGNGNMGIKPEYLQGRNIGQDFDDRKSWRMYHGQQVPGFPYHPHRGFETVTINKEGFVDHSDSLGAAGRFGAGDVQWMTAGRGVQHSEMFPLINDDTGNTLEIFQIWLNLPKVSKFVEPHFRMLWREMIQTIKFKDSQGKTTEVDVIAGSLSNIEAPKPTPHSWAANPANGVAIFTVKMEAGALWTLPACTSTNVNRSLYFYRGSKLEVEGKTISSYHQVRVIPNVDITLQNGEETAHLLILQGKPINEPVAQHGPFVMNTPEEIRQAFEDYQRTQFGGWPWKVAEVVHNKDKGRFALYSDGSGEEIP